MSTLTLKPFIHRGAEQIGIYFSATTILNECARRIKGIKWSKTYCCWYVSLNDENCRAVLNSFSGTGDVDLSLLKVFLEKKKQVEATVVTQPVTSAQRAIKSIAATSAFKLSDFNINALARFVTHLKLKAYS